MGLRYPNTKTNGIEIDLPSEITLPDGESVSSIHLTGKAIVDLVPFIRK